MLANALVLKEFWALLGTSNEGRALAASREHIPDRSMAGDRVSCVKQRCTGNCRHRASREEKDSLSGASNLICLYTVYNLLSINAYIFMGRAFLSTCCACSSLLCF